MIIQKRRQGGLDAVVVFANLDVDVAAGGDVFGWGGLVVVGWRSVGGGSSVGGGRVQSGQLVGRSCRLRGWVKRDHFLCAGAVAKDVVLSRRFLKKLKFNCGSVCLSYSLACEAQRICPRKLRLRTPRDRYATAYLGVYLYTPYIRALGIRNLRQLKQGSDLLAASYLRPGPPCLILAIFSYQ